MRNIIVPLFVISSLSANAQTYFLSCSYAGGSSGSGLYEASDRAKGVIEEICDVLGQDVIPIYRGDVPNAAAINYNGRRLIVYNSAFLNSMIAAGEWAPVSILAHEVGHHVDYNNTWFGTFEHSWTRELKADYISGYVLARMGASRDEATAAQWAYFQYIGSESHPDSPRRINAITAGWRKGKGMSNEPVPCHHPMHPNGDLYPCTHGAAHFNGDIITCGHVCYDFFGNPFRCHPAGDIVPCSHPVHPMGDVQPCTHVAHPSGH